MDFWHNTGTITALELINKLRIDSCRTASETQKSVHSAEIAKYVECCL